MAKIFVIFNTVTTFFVYIIYLPVLNNLVNYTCQSKFILVLLSFSLHI